MRSCCRWRSSWTSGQSERAGIRRREMIRKGHSKIWWDMENKIWTKNRWVFFYVKCFRRRQKSKRRRSERRQPSWGAILIWWLKITWSKELLETQWAINSFGDGYHISKLVSLFHFVSFPGQTRMQEVTQMTSCRLSNFHCDSHQSRYRV